MLGPCDSFCNDFRGGTTRWCVRGCSDKKKTKIISHGNGKKVSEGSWEMRLRCVSVWGQSLSNHQSAGSLVVLLQSKSMENDGLLLQPVRVEQFNHDG